MLLMKNQITKLQLEALEFHLNRNSELSIRTYYKMASINLVIFQKLG
jgi:hypothetical protein